MRKLIFLGTGGAMATNCYNACFLLRTPDGEYFLTDAGGGNGILRQMKDAEVSFERLRVMFVSHGHGDHILGALWVIRKIASLMAADYYPGEFHIYGHDIVCQILDMMAQMLLTRKELDFFGKRILLREVRDGEEFSFLGMKFLPFDIRSSKTKEFGYRMRFANRRSLVFLGDEPYHERCRANVEKADWLISEAFCLEEDREKFRLREKGHCTAREAAENAEKLKAKRLILFHTEDTDLKNRKRRYTEEAAKSFGGEIFVPDDLEEIEAD